MKPWLSIIVPIFNAQDFLEDALESIFSQIDSSVEVVLVDDGSTDNSRSVIDHYASRASVVVHLQRNLGLGAARNVGIGLASGEYIWFVDSDDLIAAGSVLDLNNLTIEDEQPDVVLFSANRFYSASSRRADKKVGTMYQRRFEGANLTPLQALDSMRKFDGFFSSACCYIAKTSLLRESRLLFPSIIHEDEPFFLDLILGASDVSVLNHEFYIRRVRPGSLMTQRHTLRHTEGRSYNLNHVIQKKDAIGNSCPRLEAFLAWRVDATLRNYLKSAQQTGFCISLGLVSRAVLAGFPQTINRKTIQYVAYSAKINHVHSRGQKNN